MTKKHIPSQLSKIGKMEDKNLKLKSKIATSLIVAMLAITPVNAKSLREKVYIDNKYQELATAKLEIDKKEIESTAKPINYQNRVLVPVRTISENLGFTVDWQQETQKVIITNGEGKDYKLELGVKSEKILLNEKEIKTDVYPKLVVFGKDETRTMVPIRLVAEAFNQEVNWNQEKQTVEITHKKEEKAYKQDAKAKTKKEKEPVKEQNKEKETKPETKEKESLVEVDGNIVKIKNITGKYKISTLDNPTRFVIDVEDAKIKEEVKKYTNTISGITEIRVANNEKGLRVVLDAGNIPKDSFNLEVMELENNLAIYIKDLRQEKNFESIFEEKEKEFEKNTKKESSKSDTVPDTSELESIINDINNAKKEAPTVTPIETKINKDGLIDRTKESTLIVIDAGHGGKDSGALSTDKKSMEKTIALQTAQKLEVALNEKGYKTFMSRSDDTFVDIYKRARTSNSINATLFISLHCNSTPSNNRENVDGVEVLYAPRERVKRKSEDQSKFAKLLLNNILAETNANSRGIKARPDLVVLNSTDATAALIEMGFMSNSRELAKLEDGEYQNRIVSGIVKAVSEYIEK